MKSSTFALAILAGVCISTLLAGCGDDEEKVVTPTPFSVGTTDADGRITLDDRRLFPYLYDLPDFPATSEDGETIGTISLTSTVRFYLRDPDTGAMKRFDREVTGSTNPSFTWDPVP